MAIGLTKSQTDLNNSTWVDINPCYGENSLPMRLPDAQSVMYCSLYALLNCPIGDRGGIFEPEYGSDLFWYLQEPCDAITAEKVKMSLITTFSKWEPRIQLDTSATTVTPNIYLPGFEVHIEGVYLETNTVESADLTIVT